MKKDILIIGPSHSGKTSITNDILKKHNSYEPLRGDATMIALQDAMLQYVRRKNGFYHISESILNDKQTVEYLYTLYEQLKIDLYETNRNIIIDTYTLNLEDVINIFGDTCDIYCLGMPNEDIKNLALKIRKTASPNDWTCGVGQRSLELFCDEIISSSQKMQDECKKYNINFFDMSGNREEKIAKVIAKIEENSILTENI